MPFSILKNPFSEAKKRKKDDAALVGELLGPEEEAEMREAMGDQPVEEDLKGDDTIRLTPEEEVVKKRIEEGISPEQRWREFVEWAEEFGLTDEWVGETFTFNADGSVGVEGSLDLGGARLTRFPRGLTRIGGDLNLDYCKELISLEYLPSSIGGNLDLAGCWQLKDIPDAIQVGGKILLDENQAELKANAEAKGYKVGAL